MVFSRRTGLTRTAGALALGLLATLSASGSAWAQSRTIKYIVPLAPGGPNDTVARLVAEQIGRDGGPTLVVENKPGAGTVIGTEFVARSAPDGNTILMAAGSFVVNPHLKKLNYDPMTSFEPVCYLAESPQMILVPASSPYKTLADFVAAAKAKPDELTIAANGPATTQHVQIEALKLATGAKLTFVPFPGDGPSLNAVVGEQVSAAALDYATAAGQIKAGKLRVIVVGTAARLDFLPDVQTFAEAGVKDTEWAGTFGIMAPAKTPKSEIDMLSGWVTKALKSPDLREKFAALGIIPKGQCGAEYGAFVRKQSDTFARTIEAAHIKAD